MQWQQRGSQCWRLAGADSGTTADNSCAVLGQRVKSSGGALGRATYLALEGDHVRGSVAGGEGTVAAGVASETGALVLALNLR